MRNKFYFEEFLVEYFNEVKEIDKNVTNYTDWLNKVPMEELVEIANLYGNREYARGQKDWKLLIPEATIDDIPELNSLKR